MNATPMPWYNDYPLTAEQVNTLLTQQFPELTLANVQRLSEGWDNVTWLVDDQWLFRFPKHDNAAHLLNNELALLPVLQQLPLCVPQPQFMGAPSTIYPHGFYGHAFLPGETLDRAVLTLKEREQLAVPIGLFLKALHAFPLAEAKTLAVSQRCAPLFHYELVQKSFRYLIKHGVLAKHQPAIDYFNDWCHIDVPNLRVLAHGDFYARHLLVDEQHELTAVIDWGDAELIHPAIDLGIVYQLLPVAAHEAFWNVYGEVSDNTQCLAKLRATYSTITLMWYAHKVNDKALLTEGLFSLNNLNITVYDL